MKKYQEWAKREYSLRHHLVVLGCAGLLVVLILPSLLVVSSAAIDQWLHLPGFVVGAINPIAGLLLIVGGLFLGLWSVYAQITIGMGTPVPLVPTRKLVVKKPFTCCRNPMTLGTFLIYVGIAVWIGSFSAIALVVFFIAILLLYIKLIEEKELEARFGLDYLAYKRNTPFILPRLRSRS
jgi:protein-S-isoprenylcysteine O-methyltransferase Ste14